LFKKFRVKFAQVSKTGFVVFGQSFGKQAVSFGKVHFSWLAFLLGKVRFVKSASVLSAKVSASLGQAFSPGLFLLA